MTKKLFYITSIFIALLYSCSVEKNIPDGRYLLNSASIKVVDKKNIDAVELESFMRQVPTSTMRLGFYNMVGQDTSKWINRFFQRSLGAPPVLYNKAQTGITMDQLKKELDNQGYLNSRVDTIISIKGKKLSLRYDITANDPYLIRDYKVDVNDNNIKRALLGRRGGRPLIKEGDVFDKQMVEQERLRLVSNVRNAGYYAFSKDDLYYKADTTLNSNQADLYLSMYPSKTKDSLYHKYYFRDVTILSGYDLLANNNSELFANPDTVMYRGIKIIYGKNNFLRKSTLVKNNFLVPGKLYSDFRYTYTYNSFTGIGAVKQTNIVLTPVAPLASDTARYVDALITLSPANTHWFQAALDGTNSAGDLGIAPSVSYNHKNLFNGSEILTVRLNGSYEFINSDESSLWDRSYFSYGIETSLAFPQILFPWLGRRIKNIYSASTQFSLGLNYQRRPEYERRFFNGTITYRWLSNRYKYSHSLDFFDVNYISMPWVSEKFQEEFLGDNPLLAASYQNQLIARTAYTFGYTNTMSKRSKTDTYTLRAGVDIGGWLPRLVSSVGTKRKDENGQYTFLGVPFSEYIGGDLSFAHTFGVDARTNIAYHLALGVIYPYGNSKILPYEKRYFAGGANSLRGWSTRTLGPGSYKSVEGENEFASHVGDIKLEASIEYRHKTSDMFELAGFIDAGNIWTIKDYESQPGGFFEFSRFYKEIAASYGVGVRLDLDFLVLRLDFGMKAYDPSRDLGNRLVMFKPRFSRDFAWHFAIGYPF